MARDASHRFDADVSFADVPMAIDTRIVRSTRIVEVDRPHVFQANSSIHLLNQRVQSVFFPNVISGSERMRRIKTDSECKRGTAIHYLAQMFEAMSDTFTLPCRVLQKNSKRA